MNYIIHRTDTFFQHSGVKGQKWGVRRYQNEDGSYKSGAEGRYAKPVKGTISGPKNSIGYRSGMPQLAKPQSAPSKKLTNGYEKAEKKMFKDSAYSKSKTSGGGSKAEETEETNEKIDRNNIHIYDVSEKLPEKGSKTSKGGGKGSGGSSKKTDTEKKEKSEKKSTFKPNDLYDKIDGLDLDSLSDTDRKELDDLIKEWRTYRSTHTASNKRSREIDEFIQRYEQWKSMKHSNLQTEYELYHGVFGMKWKIGRRTDLQNGR